MNTDFLQKMSKGQQITAAGGVTALIASFLPWYVLKDQFIDNVSFRGTEFTFGWMGLVLLLAAVGLTVAPAFGKDVGEIVGNDKIVGEQVAIAAAALGSLLWLIRLVQVPALFFSVMGRGFGLFVAAAAAAAVTTGIVMTMKEKGIAMPNGDTIADLRSSGSTPPAPAAMPPAPHAAPAPAPYAAPAPQAAPAPAPHAPPVATPPAPQAGPAPTPPQNGRF